MQKFGINQERISLKNQKLPKVETDKTIGRRLSRESTGSSEKNSALEKNIIVKSPQTRPEPRIVEKANGIGNPAGQAPEIEQKTKKIRSRKPRKKQKKLYKKKYFYNDTYREFYCPPAYPLFFPSVSKTCNTNLSFTPRNSPRHSDIPVDIPKIYLSNNISKLKNQNSVPDNKPNELGTALQPLTEKSPFKQKSAVTDLFPQKEPDTACQKQTLSTEPQIFQDKKENRDDVDKQDEKQKNKKTKCKNNSWILVIVVVIMFLLMAAFYSLGRTA